VLLSRLLLLMPSGRSDYNICALGVRVAGLLLLLLLLLLPLPLTVTTTTTTPSTPFPFLPHPHRLHHRFIQQHRPRP
jgi:hypothetical protein